MFRLNLQAAGASPASVFVEYGTWIGASSRCIAAGLREGRAPPGVFHAHDTFELERKGEPPVKRFAEHLNFHR